MLDGITVGGHKLDDQQVAVNQGNAWHYLFKSVKSDDFSFTKPFVCDLHSLAAKEEALEWGQFRSGMVTIAGSSYMPPTAGELEKNFDELVVSSEQITDIYDKGIHAFLQMARNQFFDDVNERTGRLMMNGILLNAGYPALNLPAKRKLEFNEKMMRFYDSNDENEMNQFMRSCIDPRVVKIMCE